MFLRRSNVLITNSHQLNSTQLHPLCPVGHVHSCSLSHMDSYTPGRWKADTAAAGRQRWLPARYPGSGAECMDLLASNMPGLRRQPTSSLVLQSWPRCHHKFCLSRNPCGHSLQRCLALMFAFTVSVFDDPLHTSSAQAGSKSCKKQDYHSENDLAEIPNSLDRRKCRSCRTYMTVKANQKDHSGLGHVTPFSSLSGASLSFSFSSDLQ